MANAIGDKIDKLVASMTDNTASNNMPPGVIPNTTNTKKEMSSKRYVFRTLFFPINNNDDAEDYSSFMNWIMEPNKGRSVIREESSWTKDGELIRVVDFVKFLSDNTKYTDYDIHAGIEEKKAKDVFNDKAESSQKTEDYDIGERFNKNDYVE